METVKCYMRFIKRRETFGFSFAQKTEFGNQTLIKLKLRCSYSSLCRPKTRWTCIYDVVGEDQSG